MLLILVIYQTRSENPRKTYSIHLKGNVAVDIVRVETGLVSKDTVQKKRWSASEISAYAYVYFEDAASLRKRFMI